MGSDADCALCKLTEANVVIRPQAGVEKTGLTSGSVHFMQTAGEEKREGRRGRLKRNTSELLVGETSQNLLRLICITPVRPIGALCVESARALI